MPRYFYIIYDVLLRCQSFLSTRDMLIFAPAAFIFHALQTSSPSADDAAVSLPCFEAQPACFILMMQKIYSSFPEQAYWRSSFHEAALSIFRVMP